MRLLVCGGRDYDDEETVHKTLDRVHAKRPITMIIEGGCRTVHKPSNRIIGADYFAHTWALSREITCVTEPAKWKAHGKAAGPIRNGVMLEKWNPEGVVSFPGGRGTEDMTSKAAAAGIKVMPIPAASATQT